MKVYKFGGGVLNEIPAFQGLNKVIPANPREPYIIVISAIGKTTNDFENLVNTVSSEPESSRMIMKRILDAHIKISKELLNRGQGALQLKISDIFKEIELKLNVFREKSFEVLYDQIVAYGEILSSIIVSEYLNECGIKNKWIDARKIIITDSHYRSAGILENETRERIDKYILQDNDTKIFITQGFIGSNVKGLTTTLGREGSDFSAAILACAVKANEVIIWKDVPGIFNADPKKYTFARQLPKMSFNEAEELTLMGSKVLHPKTLMPVRRCGVPLNIRKFEPPYSEGTVIFGHENMLGNTTLIAHKENVAKVKLYRRFITDLPDDNMNYMSMLIYRYGLNVYQSIPHESGMTIYVANDPSNIHTIINEAAETFTADYETGFEIIRVKNLTDEVIKFIVNHNYIEAINRVEGMTEIVIRNQ